MHHPSRGGVRGGKDQFEWESIKTDKHRENYLGHSVMAPVGRWQKGKDLTWYAKDKETKVKQQQTERHRIRQLEEEAMAAALGFGTVKKKTSSLTKQEIAETLKRGQTERESGNVERVEGMGFGSSRAAMMDSSRTNDGFVKEPEAKIQMVNAPRKIRGKDEGRDDGKDEHKKRKKKKKHKVKKSKETSKGDRRKNDNSKRRESRSESAKEDSDAEENLRHKYEETRERQKTGKSDKRWSESDSDEQIGEHGDSNRSSKYCDSKQENSRNTESDYTSRRKDEYNKIRDKPKRRRRHDSSSIDENQRSKEHNNRTNRGVNGKRERHDSD